MTAPLPFLFALAVNNTRGEILTSLVVVVVVVVIVVVGSMSSSPSSTSSAVAIKRENDGFLGGA
jgi:hypothetical protein